MFRSVVILSATFLDLDPASLSNESKTIEEYASKDPQYLPPKEERSLSASQCVQPSRGNHGLVVHFTYDLSNI